MLLLSRRLLLWTHELPLRVATKFAIAFTVCSFLGAVGIASLLAAREARRLHASVETDLRAQASALVPLLGEVWSREGEGRMREFAALADAADPNVDVGLVRSAVSGPARTGDTIAVSAPVEGPDGALHLQLTRPVPPFSSLFIEELVITVSATALLAVISFAIVYVLGDWLVGAPLRRVVHQAHRIADGDLTHRLAVHGSREIAGLKHAVNAMCDALRDARADAEVATKARIDAVERLRHADRLTTVGTLTAGIAHELGTPLNVVFLESRALERQAVDPARVERGAKTIRQQAERMTSIVKQLLGFARRKRPESLEGDLGQAVVQAVELVRPLARTRGNGIEIGMDLAHPEVKASFDGGAIQQVMTNLLLNAFDAAPENTTVNVRVGTTRRSRPGEEEEKLWAHIEVEDHGAGMDEVTRERIFEPFFTTKDVGRGTGLGLSVVLGIVEDHGGFVDVRSAVGRGTTFGVFVPANDVESAREGSGEPRS